MTAPSYLPLPFINGNDIENHVVISYVLELDVEPRLLRGLCS